MMKRLLVLSLFLSVCTGTLVSQTIRTTLTYSVNLPAKRTAKTPVLILLHGYGSNEADLFDISKALDPRFITFSLRAPNELQDGGFCWYQLGSQPDRSLKYDYNEAKLSREKVLSFISNACKVYQLDSTQVFLLGFSQGAILSYDIAFSSPHKIKGVLALSGRVMAESKEQVKDAKQLAQVKFFIAHGNSDNVIKIEEAEKANAFLKEKAVADLTYKNYEMPHSLSGAELNDIKSWLVKAITPVIKAPATKK